MKIAEKLVFVQEESNTSSGYSSRDDCIISGSGAYNVDAQNRQQQNHQQIHYQEEENQHRQQHKHHYQKQQQQQENNLQQYPVLQGNQQLYEEDNQGQHTLRPQQQQKQLTDFAPFSSTFLTPASSSENNFPVVLFPSLPSTRSSPQQSDSTGHTVGSTILPYPVISHSPKYLYHQQLDIPAKVGKPGSIGDESLNMHNKHSRCISPTYSCCQRNEMLMRVNEELLQQKRGLEERNQSLSEELKVSRRFYQSTLADLTAQLSIAENRIKYLKEVVSTQEEVLQNRDKDKYLPHVDKSKVGVEHFTQPPSVSGTNRPSKSLPTSPRAVYLQPDTARSSTGSVNSDSSLSTTRTRLNLKNFAKMKEQLLEKNQNLKTDIELLKYKSEIPRCSSVPSLNNPSSVQELPAIVNKNRQNSGGNMTTHHILKIGNDDDYTSRRSDISSRYAIPHIE